MKQTKSKWTRFAYSLLSKHHRWHTHTHTCAIATPRSHLSVLRPFLAEYMKFMITWNQKGNTQFQFIISVLQLLKYKNDCFMLCTFEVINSIDVFVEVATITLMFLEQGTFLINFGPLTFIVNDFEISYYNKFYLFIHLCIVLPEIFFQFI